jgi:hypothetical protein
VNIHLNIPLGKRTAEGANACPSGYIAMPDRATRGGPFDHASVDCLIVQIDVHVWQASSPCRRSRYPSIIVPVTNI